MDTLYLIRHSITDGNEKHWYYGATDLPLSDEGRTLCRSQAGSYTLPDDVVFGTSGMLRANETLRLMFGDVPFRIFSGLAEMNVGKFEKHTYEELKDDADFIRWCDDDTFVIPGGESNTGFTQRVTESLQQIIFSNSGHLFIVCHSGSIRRAMTVLFPESGKGFWDWRPDCCHGYAIHFQNHKPVSYETI